MPGGPDKRAEPIHAARAPMAETLEARTRQIHAVIAQLNDAFQRCEA
jgi:hypothetical protein